MVLEAIEQANLLPASKPAATQPTQISDEDIPF
jgi:hypothetical protein